MRSPSWTVTWSIVRTVGPAPTRPSRPPAGRRAARALAWGVALVALLAGCTRPAVLDVTIDQADPALLVGQSVRLTVTVTTVGNASRNVAWMSSAPGVASVAGGTVTGLAPGTARITATSSADPRVRDSVLVTVAGGDGTRCELGDLAPAALHDAGRERVLVRYRQDLTATASLRASASSEAAAVAAAAGGERLLQGWAGGTDLLVVPSERVDDVLASLRRQPAVAIAVRDFRLARLAPPDDPFYATHQWNLSAFGADAAWATVDGTTPAPGGAVIAVVDDGVAVDHPDLAAVALPGWDAVEFDTDPRNCIDHGTHVAGIAAAVRGNAVGIAGVGAAAGVRLLPVKAWATTATERGAWWSDIELAMRWAAGLPVGVPVGRPAPPPNPHPADVINLSLGIAASAVTSSMAALMQAAIADVEAAGALVVAAAGNAGSPGGVDYPARAGAVAVGSVNASGLRSAFSNHGTGLTLTAPGGSGPSPCGGVFSTTLRYDPGSGTVSPDYGCKQGTSMATPYVAGAAALLIAAEPGLRGDPAAIRARLLAAAALRPGASDSEYGAGILCLDALLGTGTVCGVP